MKQFIGTIVSLLIVSLGFGQTVSQPDMPFLRSVIPSSPTAGSLGKYADWPVSLYTGVPEVSIPLYELHARSISIPISLTYHASGIRVSEIASWVGLGWSLNAGGVINRTVHGFPDETNAGFLEFREQYSDLMDLTGTVILDEQHDSGESNDQDLLNLIAVANGGKDSQPDQFSISILGRSYRLLYTERRDSLITQPYSRMKVIMHEGVGAIDSFTVTLEDGARMTFGTDGFYDKIFQPRYGFTIGELGNCITAWHLKEIITAQNEVINFNYSSEGVKQAAVFSETEYDKRIENSSQGPGNGRYFYEPEARNRRLMSITSDLETIEFDSVRRWDLIGASALANIKVKSALDGQDKRQFDFRYEYSEATPSLGFSNDSTYLNRLKLMTIREVAGDSVAKVWDFEYNGLSLPGRLSYAQDHWGYFNGATDNGTMLPFSIAFDPIEKKYGNRNPSMTAPLAEILTKVYYPTGGYSEFNYEVNSVSDMIDVYQRVNEEKVGEGATTFHITEPQIVYFTLTADFLANDFGKHVNLLNASISLVGSGTHVDDGFLAISSDDLPTTGSPDGEYYGGDRSVLLALDTGRYIFSVSDNSEGSIARMYASVRYQKYMGQQTGYRAIGGIRIKSINDYDPNTDQTVTRSFTYEQPFFINPISNADYVMELPARIYDGSSTNFIEFSSLARYSAINYSQSDVQGGTVGYGKVTTSYGPGGIGGKTVSYFSNEADEGVTIAKSPPFVPVTSRSWRRGLLLKEEQFDATGVLLRTTNNTYDFVSKCKITTFKAAPRYISGGSEFQPTTDVDGLIVKQFYDVITEQVNLTKTERWDFVYQGLQVDTIKTLTNYFFDNASNPQPTRIETVDSRKILLKTVNQGPLEKTVIDGPGRLSTNAKAALNDMIARNMLNYPVRSYQYRGDVLIDSVVTNYKKWGSNITAPQNVVVRNGKGPIETRVTFSKYDPKGNLLEQSKLNDVKTSYIYDYKSRYPIAQVVNSDVASVAYTSFEADGFGGWTVIGGNLTDMSAVTGTKVHSLSSGASVQKTDLVLTTKYILSFWYKTALPTISGGTKSNIRKLAREDGWTYYEVTISNATSITLSSSTSVIDEVRLYPLTAQMVTYTYDPVFGVTSTTDANGKPTYYIYDLFGRLTMTKDHNNNVTGRYTYRYQIR